LLSSSDSSCQSENATVLRASPKAHRSKVSLLRRQPAVHLSGDAQSPCFVERIAPSLSQRHLACLRDHFRRSGIPSCGPIGQTLVQKKIQP
jgi:hypothetical protein